MAAFGVDDGRLWSGSLWSRGDFSVVCGVGSRADAGGLARLWRIGAGGKVSNPEQLPGTWPDEVSWFSAAAFSPNGAYLFTAESQRDGGGRAIAMWDIRDLVARPYFVAGNRGAEIHWDVGDLQFSSDLNGGWTTIPASSPFRLSPIGEKGFFRVKIDDQN